MSFTISIAAIGSTKPDSNIFSPYQAAPAGIAETLLQSHEGYVEFIPALPPKHGPMGISKVYASEEEAKPIWNGKTVKSGKLV